MGRLYNSIALIVSDTTLYCVFLALQVGNRAAVVEVTDPRQSVYIYGCRDTLVQVGNV